MWQNKDRQILHYELLELAEKIKNGFHGQANFSDPHGFRLTVFPLRAIICNVERVKGNDEKIGRSHKLSLSHSAGLLDFKKFSAREWFYAWAFVPDEHTMMITS